MEKQNNEVLDANVEDNYMDEEKFDNDYYEDEDEYEEQKPQKKKKGKTIIIILLILLWILLLCALLFFSCSKRDSESENKEPEQQGPTLDEGTIEQEEEEEEEEEPVEEEYIDVNIYSDIVLSKGEVFSMENPATNSEDVLFTFQIYINPTYEYKDGVEVAIVDVGTRIYSSGLIAPGKAATWVPSNYLPEGVNSVLVLVDFYNPNGEQYGGGNVWFPWTITIQ